MPENSASTLPAAVLPAPRDGIAGAAPYGAPQLEVEHALNVNENPYGPSAELAEAIGRAASEAALGLNRYPDREALGLRADLGAYLAVESGISAPAPEAVWAANGSNEIMHQLLLAYGGPGRTALGFTPHYSMYPEYARDTYTDWVTAERGPAPEFELTGDVVTAAITAHRPSIVVLTSPNNPTGTALALDVVAAAATALAETRGLLVVDEAYSEFRRDGVPSALTLLEQHPNIVVTRTMSKAFALAGARLGYLVADPAIVDTVRVVRLPYHLSAVTQAVARAALAHRDELLGKVALLRSERDALAQHLVERGHSVAPSDANFILFRTFSDRDAVFEALLDRSVLVRAVGPAGWLRVSIGTPENNAAFRTALEEADPR
ncbi:histidinol-phosphate transaminase [Brachybacterium alimentarium]|uniref:histidinol-phosphate transaminase n=1 Tax=Brachybacterium alimentarium TaxID=47845 RepID=UPI000DF3B4AC|nr:histidinol-phosphate transaminase [Brachybacterium alimentarium]RCS65450.1 histidinol-phosphate transaminase [Brachybacterium alimentarium]RCS84103.1 histidinol-phosphate transaminase [Brachybacterium alimentarium]RCS86546.1 histidinol-phosphate transaminase [Brachybacterium alimentarium]